MSKRKTFNPSSRGNLKEKAAELKVILNDAPDDIKEKAQQFNNNPQNFNNLVSLSEAVKNSNDLVFESKNEIMVHIQSIITEHFALNNIPQDYETLKKEAKFFSELTQYSFILMAQRLKKIRDEKLYTEDGYLEFQDFIKEELTVQKSTIYNYIDIYTYFGNFLKKNPGEIPYSKIVPFIPILRIENNSIPKEEIIKQVWDDMYVKSQRDLIKEATNLKVQYGLIKNRVAKSKDEYTLKDNKIYKNKELVIEFSKEIDKKIQLDILKLLKNKY